MNRPDNALLRQLPSVSDLLVRQEVCDWLDEHPRRLVVDSIRDALGELRNSILHEKVGHCGPGHVTPEAVLSRAEEILRERCHPHICRAINATGILLHTALGRAVWPECVVDDVVPALKGYATLAIDRETGKRSERDHRVEAILCELTGAEAATVVNNNAAATLLVLAALCAGREVIVSRGQLIEIGGSFRLPDVMAQSGAQMVEVGATNRTHLRDYERAIGEETAAIFRAHPSNFRIVGFAKQVPTAKLAELAHAHNVLCIDDLGAGALVDLRRFGLGCEPTVQESLSAGADVALFSGDKLIGASQCGILVGRAEAIRRVRTHPLARALRPDKSCLMVLERTLALFRDPDRLVRDHPLYRMLSLDETALRDRAEALAAEIPRRAKSLDARSEPSQGYLGSGSLPDEALPGWCVRVTGDLAADQLAARLRMDPARVFCRIDSEAVVLDVRTLLDGEAEIVAAALARCAQTV